HSIEVVMQKEEYQKMTSKMQKSSFVIEDIIVHCEIIQTSQELHDNLDSTQQMILKKVKEVLRTKHLKSPFYQKKAWLSLIRPFVEQFQGTDPFLENGE